MLNIYVGIEEMQKINFIMHHDIYFLLYMTDDLIAHLVL
jgi:translation initiation factor RLI1